jgi:hypothetical protein
LSFAFPCQALECSAIHLTASCSVIKPLIASVSPSGHRISTPQPDPGFFRATKVGRCSDIPRICACGGPVQASDPATIKLTHYPPPYAVLSFGGFLGNSDDHYPLRWQSLKYTNLGDYTRRPRTPEARISPRDLLLLWGDGGHALLKRSRAGGPTPMALPSMPTRPVSLFDQLEGKKGPSSGKLRRKSREEMPYRHNSGMGEQSANAH